MNFIDYYDIGINKPPIPESIYNSWQGIVDSLATIAYVPSALVMHVLPDKIEVASTSHTRPEDNPYEVNGSEHLGCGLYCETVIKTKDELYVKNSLEDEAWIDNPDVAIDMISYYGQPILWSDNTVYGTLCILDKKDLIPTITVKRLLGLLRKSIENDLEILEQSYFQEMLLKAEIDKQTKQIKAYNNELVNLNKGLEERVKEEVEKNRQKDQQIFQQSRLAQMGEMISMIAHQWRQPLASISSSSIDLEMKLDLEFFDLEQEKGRKDCKKYMNASLKIINKCVENLTTTIDDFRNFYKPNKKSVKMKLSTVVEKSLSLVKTSLISKNIEIIEEYNSNEKIELYNNEMIQVILNILKNAQDNFEYKSIKSPYIKIITGDRMISIYDNGGGIPEDIIEKIFDPYFSTKDEKNGTGLGLYMSKTIIEDHHDGKLNVENIDDGVCFSLEL